MFQDLSILFLLSILIQEQYMKQLPSRTFCVVSYVPNPSRGLLFCVGVLTLDVFFFQVSVGQSEAKVYKLNFACIFELSTMSIHTCHNFEH